MGVFENHVVRFVCQLYEIQTPAEAEALVAMGVDHIGTVLMADDAPSNRQVGETIAAARRVGACSSLIPLFSEPARIMAALDELQPDIVHFQKDYRKVAQLLAAVRRAERDLEDRG